MVTRLAHTLGRSDGYHAPAQFHYRQARQAIEDMRQPTDQMRNAYCRLNFGRPMFDADWERMIDAALAG